jgi:WD40 repeat protein
VGFRDAERLRQTHGATRDAALRSRDKLLPTALLGSRINPLVTFRGHRKEVFCAVFDRSGRRAITGADDHLVKIWWGCTS